MNWFNKKEKTPLDEQKEKMQDILGKTEYKQYESSLEDKKPKEKWIFVEGYKGLSADMTATHGNNMQYELNKTYGCPKSNVKVCSSGFHFSKTLRDAMLYYPPKEGNRYFKVKALVRETDYKNYGKYYEIPFAPYSDLRYMPSARITKLSSCNITLIEEVPFEEIKKHIRHPYIKDERRYKMNAEELQKDIEIQFTECLKVWHYTPEFIHMIYTDIFGSVSTREDNKSGPFGNCISTTLKTNYNSLKAKQEKLEIVTKNFESRDMLTMYLMKGGF